MVLIQVSQETGKMVWYLFKSFPQFVMIHTVSEVDEPEVDVFLEFSCFLCDPTNVAILSPVPLLFLP